MKFALMLGFINHFLVSMSSFKTELSVQATQGKASEACRYALSEMQLAIKHDDGLSFTANEKVKLLGFANPAKIEVKIQPGSDVLTIFVYTSNLGLGPFQGDHVRGVAETFLSKFQLKLGESTQAGGPSGISDELQKLASLKEQGILTEAEFIAAKARLIAQ